MCRGELQHSFGKQGGMTLLGSIITAHSSSQYIEKHVLSTYNLIISAAHKMPQKLYSLIIQCIFRSFSI